MNKLYQKSELVFSLVWIGLYVVLLSLADGLSEIFGTVKLITAPICFVFVVALLIWIFKKGFLKKYGLCKTEGNAKNYLYFIPLTVIGSCNLWFGVKMNYSLAETLLFVFSMLCVGFIEEVIFRGFLFKALCMDNVKRAIIISSVTFGIGHIVNLLNGAKILPTMLQIVYAIAVGFAFTVLFYKSGSILPCIITHMIVNATSVFRVEPSGAFEIVTAVIITLVAVFYGVCILKMTRVKG